MTSAVGTEERKESIFVPQQFKTQLEDFEVRKHYKGSVTTKENRGQKLTRKMSGIRKSVSNKITKQMDMYESVFEEGRRRSIRRKKSTEELELDWSNKSNHAGVKVLYDS